MRSKTLMLVVAALHLLLPLGARAHCDTLDGPVVKAARAALDAADVAPALAWVKPGAEEEVRAAFQRALAARQAGSRDLEASDRSFFEALVRAHRAGEGADYDGLKAAGAGTSAALQAADAGVERGDGSPAESLLADAVRASLRARFARLAALPPPGADVAAGRRWVEAYVAYVHHVERLDAVARGAAGDHAGDGEHAPEVSPPRAAADAPHRR